MEHKAPHMYVSGRRYPVMTILSTNILPVLGMTCQCNVKLKSFPRRLLPWTKNNESERIVNTTENIKRRKYNIGPQALATSLNQVLVITIQAVCSEKKRNNRFLMILKICLAQILPLEEQWIPMKWLNELVISFCKKTKLWWNKSFCHLKISTKIFWLPACIKGTELILLTPAYCLEKVRQSNILHSLGSKQWQPLMELEKMHGK